MTRRPIFWVVFSVLGIAGAITAIELFNVALPSVSLDISMDREAAMSAAADLAAVHGWGPEGARTAASFGQVDSEVQTYVELEGGGRDAFQGLMDAGVYYSYQWRVRRFAEGEVEETEVRFSPAGDPYGFELTLAEDDPGAGNLSEPEARALAEREAAAWPVDLTPYDLIESSDETQPGGRVDHTFVYERNDIDVADAGFRLRLVVAGDRLSELTHFVFVPEAFSRRYADMRSTNDGIALVSQSIFILFYILLGAGVGTALLLRERWVEWRKPLAWGAVIALLFGLNSLNALPLAWMSYDTALGASTFVLQNVAAAGAIIVLGAPILGFFFMAGESLGRRAFPDHVQQWRFWNREVAASKPALGITVAAYLLVGMQVGYVILFYLGTARLEGWWSPADALVQPDLLATYLPWLQAVSTALFAAFWEESIFRAVPIACAALLGSRFGRRSWWIWGAVFVQALIFASGHANYPQQPPYARVVELYLPALGWGIVYLFFGLVPTILAHFLYDLSLISTVLFASDAVFDEGVIVLVAAIPLAVALWARRGGRGTSAIPAWARNGAWRPRAVAEESGSQPDGQGAEAGLSVSAGEGASVTAATVGAVDADGADEADGVSRSPAASGVTSVGRAPPSWVAPAVGVLGIALWLGGRATAAPKEPLRIGRVEAIEVARGELERSGFDMTGWSPSATAGDGRSSAHQYVFEEAGPEAFQSLDGSFLAPPQWVVRFVDWDAEPADRVEEFIVNIRADGQIRRVAHTLPEGRPGAVLDEDAARALARAALPPGSWEDVGAEETSHDARTDWVFTFREPSVLADVAGEGRASVRVLGDEVTDLRRFVNVPEEWERARREANTRRSMVGIGLVFVLVLLYGATAITSIVVWSRRQLEVRPVWKASALTFAAMSLSLVNGWPSTSSAFLTAQPYNFQAGAAAFGFLLIAIVAGAAVGLVVALGHSWAAKTARPPVLLGIGLGLTVAGLGSLVRPLTGGMPPAAEYSGAATFLPVVAPTLQSVMPFLLLTSAIVFLSVTHRRARGRPALRGTTTFAILALGIVVVPDPLQESVLTWVAAGLAAAAVVWALVTLFGRIPALAPVVMGAAVVAQAIGSALDGAYSGALVGYLLASVAVAAIAWVWTRELTSP